MTDVGRVDEHSWIRIGRYDSVIIANGRDDGAERETRVKPCTKRAWCVKELGHSGLCVEVPREPHPAPNYGPKQ